MPGVFPDYPAPVVRTIDGERELIMMRWGMPPPPKFGGPPVTNICNTASPHCAAWSTDASSPPTGGACSCASNPARREIGQRTMTSVATFVKFDLQEQIPSRGVLSINCRSRDPPEQVVLASDGLGSCLVVSRRSHAERRGQIAWFAPCHRGRKREGGLRKNHDRNKYCRGVDEKRPAPGHHRSRQPAADPHPLHREPARLGPQVPCRSRVANASHHCVRRRRQGGRERGRRVRRLRQGRRGHRASP